MNRFTFSLITLLIISSCLTIQNSSSDLFYEEDNSVNLYAFIGQKITVDEFDPNQKNTVTQTDSVTGETYQLESYIMDLAFDCKYVVVSEVFNKLQKDTVEFEAYDHYGRPAFEDYDYVLLYLSISDDSVSLFHQKYLFDPVKRSSKGIWTGLKNESIKQLFNKKRETVLRARGVF